MAWEAVGRGCRHFAQPGERELRLAGRGAVWRCDECGARLKVWKSKFGPRYDLVTFETYDRLAVAERLNGNVLTNGVRRPKPYIASSELMTG